MRNFWMLLGVVMACAASPALAQVNKWVDEKGRVQYGDQPPTGKTVVKPASAPKTSPVVNPNKPPPQPKLHVPGDPLVERLRENEERRVRERLAAKCWKEELGDCNESGKIYEMKVEEKKRLPQRRSPMPASRCRPTSVNAIPRWKAACPRSDGSCGVR